SDCFTSPMIPLPMMPIDVFAYTLTSDEFNGVIRHFDPDNADLNYKLMYSIKKGGMLKYTPP
ncbi:MAG: hypothetical protein AAFY76_25125, partial [Cyanobacteria bacterium J06649_11]